MNGGFCTIREQTIMARRGRHPYNKNTKTMTEYEKQQAGMVYNAPDADLVKELYEPMASHGFSVVVGCSRNMRAIKILYFSGI